MHTKNSSHGEEPKSKRDRPGREDEGAHKAGDMNRIPLIRPYITQKIKDRVCDVLESRYLTEGPVTHDLEEAFRKYVGCNHAIAVTSCTTGLEIALRAIGVGPGDEVIVPDYTYPATADVVSIVGATPVIVDVSRETMVIDYKAVERNITSRTKAIMPVSIFGNPVDYDELMRIKSTYGVYLIEDAACSLGAEYHDKKVGSLADISIFSLHPRKFITTGEGGIVTTDNPDWANWMNSYKHFGMAGEGSRATTVFERIGTNYKLSNVLAAIGLGQMEDIEMLLAERRELAAKYTVLLEGNPGIELPRVTEGGKHSFQSYCVFVDDRDQLIRKLAEKGIEVQIGTYALHMHDAFSSGKWSRLAGNMANSRYCFDHCLTLPLYHGMTEVDQICVVDELLRTISVGVGVR
jgi:perosamine synthetase